MKALITATLLSLSLIVVSTASAHVRHVYFVKEVYAPTATCVTHATKAPLPEYVCCKKRDGNGRLLWQNTWVSGGCMNASARVDRMGCSVNSPVYGTGAPINATCQFSHTTLN